MSGRPIVNASRVATEPESDARPGYRRRTARIGPALGTGMFELGVHELTQGESLSPYHYDHGRESWMIVLQGRPTLRHPGGETPLDPGDVVCFPDGPAGAHKLSNWRDQTVRIVLFSTAANPSVTVYPDDGKLEVTPPGKIFELNSSIDFWEDDE